MPAANIWSDGQKLHTRHMPVGKVAEQIKALQLFGTGGINEADIRRKVSALIWGDLMDMMNN